MYIRVSPSLVSRYREDWDSQKGRLKTTSILVWAQALKSSIHIVKGAHVLKASNHTIRGPSLKAFINKLKGAHALKASIDIANGAHALKASILISKVAHNSFQCIITGNLKFVVGSFPNSSKLSLGNWVFYFAIPSHIKGHTMLRLDAAPQKRWIGFDFKFKKFSIK